MVEYNLIKPQELQTKQLRFCPVNLDNLEQLHQLFIHPQVRRYLWDDEIVSKEQTLNIIHQSLELFSTQNFGLWGIFPQMTETLAGFTGFWFFYDPPELQLIYGIYPNFWGQGWGTEVAQVMIHYGFNHLNFSQVIASADVPNLASIRVMEKAGMQFKKKVFIEDQETVYYEIKHR
ncbi:MAG: GNAT family N-acetyltransferase [Cyanobacteriota bacterium]|nr:GNAT family N-acetyltransferase [Cyanobacteriota bacterium]